MTEHACRDCHAEITDAIEHGTGYGAREEVGAAEGKGDEFLCTRCHYAVGHRVRD